MPRGISISLKKKKATARTTVERHKKLLEEHGWSKIFKKVDILDSELPDEELEIPNGIRFKKNYIGNKTKNYDSFLVIAHFKDGAALEVL